MTTSIYVSEKGLQRLKADLDRTERAYRAACEESARACALSGDGWHDNPYFNQSQQIEAALSRDVMHLRDLVARAVVITERERTGTLTRVEIGVWIRIALFDRVAHTEVEQLWQVVGYGEGEASERKLAYNSPVAAGLLGRSVGDVVEATLAGREVEIEVLEVLARVPVDAR